MGKYYKHKKGHRSRKKDSTEDILIYLIIWPFLLIGWIVKQFRTSDKSLSQKNRSKKHAKGQQLAYNPEDWNEHFNSVSTEKKEVSYASKSSIMSDCEKAFFEAFQEIVGDNYIVQPQINLASVVRKETASRYQNELFRNIDFGIFDKSYNLLLLIEINDRTHERSDRIQRDKKVQGICENAGIPLVVFWTKYGVNKKYIKDRLGQYLSLDTAL